jgi:hypothetical protein
MNFGRFLLKFNEFDRFFSKTDGIRGGGNFLVSAGFLNIGCTV